MSIRFNDEAQLILFNFFTLSNSVLCLSDRAISYDCFYKHGNGHHITICCRLSLFGKAVIQIDFYQSLLLTADNGIKTLLQQTFRPPV
ncbi:hypothetical protein T11_1013 [Trichinella zimbabwensis]|uniref:Uncharacterized protein n=1 Tax=Trichinella zimbabwensis TaxID=268475 RepID=A0A0V1H281_9BILA|nr:hypothetical protein T11_1013 [Trichinella zimbabwensis]